MPDRSRIVDGWEPLSEHVREQTARALGGPPEHSDGYWIGYLSTAIGEAAADIDNHNHAFARDTLRRTLKELLDTPVVQSPSLRETLRRYVK